MEPPASRNRWKQIQRIFADVVGRAPSEREARLERLCGEDRDLREAVEALLERHENGEPIGDYGDGAAVGSSPDWVSVRTPGESARAADAEEAGSLPSEAESPEGRQVGRYRLIHELGRGAMGVVYRAEDTRLGRPVALKFLSPALCTDQRARARLEREARAASALDHPNICTVYEIGEAEEGQLFLALACYDGQTLEERIDAGPLAVDEAVRVAVHVARGLAAAHRHGIVHRDVKPSNILITDEGTVKLLDFGIARVADSSLTDSGDTLGTVAYMSPEQLRGEVDARADVWALGVVLHEMLTGRRPFGGDYEAAVLYAVLHEPPAPLQRDDVPSELAEIVERCLVKNPEERYLSVEEVEVELERLGMGEASGPIRRRMPRRTRRLAYGGGVLALLLLLFLPPVRTTLFGGLGPGGPSDVQRLALLPFVSEGLDSDVGRGFSHELTRRLTQLSAQASSPISIISTSDSGPIETVDESGSRFGVDAVVRGRLRRDESRDVLAIEFVDARTGVLLRSGRVSEPGGRLPVVQQRALLLIAEMAGIPVSEGKAEALDLGGTSDSEALSLYWRATDYLERFDLPENIDTSIELFRRAVAIDSLYAGAYAGLSDAHRLKYKATLEPALVEQGEVYARRAVSIEDTYARGHAALGNIFALTGRSSEAIGELKLAVELDGLDASAHVGLAEVLQTVGRYDHAEAGFKRAIELQPGVWSHRNKLGKLYLAWGRIDEAVATFQAVIEAAPDNAWGYANLSGAYLYIGDMARAREAAQKANRLQPTASAYSNLGALAYYEGAVEEEVRMYRQALAIDSTNYMLWGNLGGAYKRLGRPVAQIQATYQRAIDLVERALVVNSRSPELLCDLSGYAVQTGDQTRAITSAETAAALAPNDATVLAQVGRVFEYLGERQDALHWFGEALRSGYPIEELEADPDLASLRADPGYAALTDSWR